MKTWMHKREIEFIKKYLSPEIIMLEWGSGGSTLEFSKYVKKYYSVENNLHWCKIVDAELFKNSIKNVDLAFRDIEPLPNDYNQPEYKHYYNYINAPDDINRLHNAWFDVVLIDGRARRLCAFNVMKYLKENSVVIIHDWHIRQWYHCVLDYYDLIDEITDTPNTIAAFKLKPNWKELVSSKKYYNLSLESFERLKG